MGTLNPEVVDQAYARFKEVYSINKINNIKVAKEEQYQEGFIKDIFGTVLGYSLFPEQPFNIQTELKNVSDSKKADGAIFQGENVIGVIELKDNKTKNLDAVKDQAFGYKNNHKDCSYVISSNFHKLRFYVDDATEYEEFDLYSLDKDTFKRLYLFLSKEKLLDANTPKILRQETKFQEENITKSLYKDYSSFKNSFFDNVVKNNPQHDKLLLFKKSQKFLDKVLFVLFAEDKGLVTTNSIVQIVEKWQSLQNDAFDTPKPLYQLVVLFFNNLFVGKKDQKGNVLIPEFGGEVFAPDEVLDALIVDDSVLHTNLLKLTKYDFNTDVDVNILGHIFEHSLSEIEEVEASLKGEIADKTKGKRKKDGVFYTPKYITKYIVENTVGKLCAEKKAELQLDIDIAVHEHQKADGKLNAKGVELYETLTRYKEWLLTLKIVDPACGSGAFLNQALNFLIEEHRFADDLIAELTNTPLRLFDTDIAILENNIYGVDINEESIEIAKLSLWLRTAKPGRKLSNLNNNIKCGNSLIDDPTVAGTKAFNWHKEFADVFANGGFDVVIGNPPYVVYLKSTVGKGTIEYVLRNYNFAEYNPNTYSLFTELSLKILKKGGQIGFIIPNTWMHNKYFSRMRHSVYQFQVNEIVYLKNTVFKEIVETVVLLLENSARYSSRIKLTVDIINVNSTINDFEYEKYRSGYNPFEENNDVIVEKMDLIDKLSKHVVIYRGLETRDNEKWIANTKIDNQYKPILLGKDVSKYNTVYSGSYVNFIKEAMKSNANEEYYYQDKILMRRTGSFIVADLDFTKSLALKNLYLII
ncbi:MAG: N-6 DNA methylase, partial [Candidatus Kapabacteria bacterium]|nr:N-6 DNA methylase [Candidatus Kapabacteria bacterium]